MADGNASVGSRACLACRKVKMRCLVDERASVCERCARKAQECVFLEHRRGRKPGTRIIRKTATTAMATPAAMSTPMATTARTTPARATRTATTPSPSSRDGADDRPQAPRPVSRGDGDVAGRFDSRDLQPPSLLHRAATQGRFSLHTVLNPAGDEAPHPSRDPQIPGQDPVQLGYVNSTIAASLFEHFINVLNPYICQLDPRLHTLDYVRQRSAFLFTTVLAVAAKTFGSSVYRTLYDHAEALMAESFRRGEKSVEIAQAIMMTTYWKEPADTRAWLSLGYVIRMGMDLGWHLLRPAAPDSSSTPSPETRNVQRTWYVLFVYDHSMSLQTGKPWMIERNDYIQAVDAWCQQPAAMPADQLLGAFVTLRLLGTEVFQLMRGAGRRPSVSTCEPLLNLLEAQLDRWEQRWVPHMAGDGRHTFMVRFYGTHLRLQLFSLFLPRVLAAAAVHEDNDGNSDTSAPPHLRILWTCYASALEMLELICQSAEWLFFAQDSIHVMTAYSAAFLVKLLLSAPASIATQIRPKIIQTIRSTSLVFSLQPTQPTSSRALQARFLEQILAGLNNSHPGRDSHDKDAPTHHDPAQSDDFPAQAGTPASFAGTVDVPGPGQQQTALDWLLEQNDAANNLFAFAGFDLEEGVFFA